MPRSFEFSWDIAGSDTLNVQEPAEVTFVFTGSESITRKAFARPRDMSVFSSGVMYADGATMSLGDWTHVQSGEKFISEVTVEISPNDEGDLVLEVWLEGDEDEIYYATLDVVEADDGPTKALPKRDRLMEHAEGKTKAGLSLLQMRAGVAVKQPEPTGTYRTNAAAVTVEVDGDDEDLDEVREDEEVIINADSETDEEEPGAYADDDEEDEPAPTEALKGSPQPRLATPDPKRMRAGTGAMTLLDDQRLPKPGAGDEAAWRAESPTSFVSKEKMREAALREDDDTTPQPASRAAPSAPATPTPKAPATSAPSAPAPSHPDDEDDGAFRIGPVVLIATFVACLVLTLGIIALLHFAKERMLEDETEVAAADELTAGEDQTSDDVPEPVAPAVPCTAVDADGDGFMRYRSATRDDCANGPEDDCNDLNASANPGAIEACGDGLDQDCDGIDPDCNDFDDDLDGVTENQGDCDDADLAVNPGAPEVCDLRDNGCDGAVDEDIDCDGDGVAGPTDCNDANATLSPLATETCDDGIDNDCDGQTDTADNDCDAYRDDDLDGLTENQGDCNDANANVHPGAEEKYCDDGIDTNCDGADPVCADVDLDGDGWSENEGDCDDETPAMSPAATEVCGDRIDNDCSGADLDCRDADLDRDGVSVNAGDCDDTRAEVNPSLTELCNDFDDNCDGQIDEGLKTAAYRDQDRDGYGAPGTSEIVCVDFENDGSWVADTSDCDDNNPQVKPGAAEVCGDGIDQDCDGSDLACPPVVERLPLCPNFAPEGPFVTLENGELAYHMVCDDGTRRACPVAKTKTLPDGRFTFNVKDCVKLP